MWNLVSAFDPSSSKEQWASTVRQIQVYAKLTWNQSSLCLWWWRKPEDLEETQTRGRAQKNPWTTMSPNLSWYVPFDCSHLIAIIIVCFFKTAQVMKTYCGQDTMSRETLDGSGAPVLDWGPARGQSAVTELLWGGPKLLACYQAPVAVVSFQCGAGSTQQPFTCVNCFLNVTPSKHRS